MTHKQKNKKTKQNKEEKHSYSVDGGFDKTF